MKTPRLADCPAIWGAVSSKGGGAREYLLLTSLDHLRRGMILGVNLSAWLRRNPTATALLSHDYTSRRLTLRLSHYPTSGTLPTLSAQLTP